MHFKEPADWAAPGFNDASWPAASIYTRAQFGSKPAYTLLEKDFGDARFVWSRNIKIDNLVLLRKTVAKPWCRPGYIVSSRDSAIRRCRVHKCAGTICKMSDAFPSIFAELRSLMLQAVPGMVIAEDTPTTFTLKTSWIEARTRQPAWFGWIAIKKSYVAYHLMPLYSLPALNDAVPPSLETRRQGKTCFNFKKADPALFEDIRLLTEAAARMEPDLRAAIGG